MSTGRKLLLVLILVAAPMAAGSALAAFRSTTASPGNSYAAGNVYLTDNDDGTGMLALTGAIPGQSETSCINVTYSGSLDATVRLYASVSGSVTPYLSLTVTRGTSSAAFDSCTGFAADPTDYIGAGAGVVYSGLLSAFPTSYAGGLVDARATAPERWTTGEVHAYKFVVTLQDAPAAQGAAGSATFTWEARDIAFNLAVLSTPGLAAYWRLADASGTTMTDATGTNSGTYHNGVTRGATSLLTTDADAAAGFDGSDDYAAVSDSASLSPTSAMSVEGWFKPETLNTEPNSGIHLVTKWETLFVYIKGGASPVFSVCFYQASTASYPYCAGGTTSVMAGATYHVVATYDGSYVRIYVNGVQEKASAHSFSPNDSTANVVLAGGSWGTVPTPRFHGVIDEVAIYTVALTAAQVQEHYSGR